MPGIVVFRRRWSIGSDDLVVPMVFMLVVHVTWLISLAIVRGVVKFEAQYECTVGLRDLILGHLVILAVCILLEAVIAFVSTRGSILIQAPRASIGYFLYTRIAVGLAELAWLVVGAVWSSRHYMDCNPDSAKKALLGMMICNWMMVLILVISLWCTFDSAGRKWVKMKKFQDSMKDRRQERRRGNNRRQSGSRRNWRQRKAFRAYEESWDRRLQLLCCCVERKGRNRNSMSEIAALFTDFFRDLDVVPSDIVAGLVLLRKHQQQRMNSIISQGSNDVYQFLSGVPITPQTKFLQLSRAQELEDFLKVIHYMRFALAVYGWPVYVMIHPGTWCCRLLPLLRYCCCKQPQNVKIVDDNCCLCNFSTAQQTSGLKNLDLVYCTYHVDIGETPFFVALDHVYQKVVVAVRGTLSLQDVLTDLKAEPETLPLSPPREDWQGHKGMIQAAVYIKKKLINDGILQMAWNRDEEKETSKYGLVLVGHSLGAGTAAILAILLKADYPNLHCYSYSPPGGLLTLPCVEETKAFITSVVVGKDCVPRVGLPQLEMLRADILNQIKNTAEAKWKIITRGLMCCGRYSETSSLDELLERDVTAHPSNSAIGLSAHVPLYPPGQMIHVVRSHIKNKSAKSLCSGSEPIYQAIWASNGDFDEVLVSPTMVNDHMPDYVLEALEKVVLKVAPEKPVHTLTEEQRREMLSHPSVSSLATPTLSDVNNSSERTHNAKDFEDEINSHNYGNNIIGNGDTLTEEDETAALFGMHKSEIEDLVRAPLASPESLSLASGVAVFNPSSYALGRDSLRHSLQRCIEQDVDILNENLDSSENREGQKNQRISNTGGDSSSQKQDKSSSAEGQDLKLALDSQSEDIIVRLRSGNTISVKADVVNEMIKLGGKAAQSTTAENNQQVHADSNCAFSERNRASHSAVLEPSSQSLHQKQEKPGLEQQRSQIETWNISDPVSVRRDPPTALVFKEGNGDRNPYPSGGGDDNGEGETYTRHSPLECNQHEYAHPNIYYSQAGIGYPHNAFHPSMNLPTNPGDNHLQESGTREYTNTCDNCSSYETEDRGYQLLINNKDENEDELKSLNFSKLKKIGPKRPFIHAESESNLLSHKKSTPKMKRSAEQDDIVHLCDALEVFENQEDQVRMYQSSDGLHSKEAESRSLEELDNKSDLVPVSSTKSSDVLFYEDTCSVSGLWKEPDKTNRKEVLFISPCDHSLPLEQTVLEHNLADMLCLSQDEHSPLLSEETNVKLGFDCPPGNAAGQGSLNSMQETHL